MVVFGDDVVTSSVGVTEIFSPGISVSFDPSCTMVVFGDEVVTSSVGVTEKFSPGISGIVTSSGTSTHTFEDDGGKLSQSKCLGQT